ncbi:MAG: N-acetylglucosamine-6-phosphate deacetylase [Candidatus Helarchaeota archaeon]|nr:N-acetylglucosamine-6-phosphate deacetylase [Candidatus Helarchaeota archaeon]
MIPGWVDLQVNGYKGIDFSNPNLSLEDINFVNVQLLEKGIVGYCPTIITSPLEVYKHNLPLIAEAQASGPKVGAQILGIHLEGPFINPKDGPRGVHPKKHVILPSIELFEQFLYWSKDKISILTLAPDVKGALKLIEHVVDTNKIVVSIGHHSAGKEIIQKSVDAGVRAATHVGNGLGNMIHRHYNPLWPILAEDRLSGLFITDGFHLPKEMVKVCLRAKGISKFIVTSDMVAVAGKDPGNYVFHNLSVVLESNGYVHLQGSTQLAGSGCNMLECMNFLATIGELDENGLYKVGFENPLKLLNMKIEREHINQAPKIVYKNRKFRLETK